MSVIDYTDLLIMGPDIDPTSVNDKYCVLGADDVVTICFSGTITNSVDGDATVAIVPSVLVANTSNIFFACYQETPNKGAAGGRIDSSGNLILNNAIVGSNYWIGGTYVRRTATE